MRRVLSIWLPSLPLDRRRRMQDARVDGPFAIIAEIKNAWRLTHLSRAARESGLTPGLSIPDARAICPDLLTEPADTSREENLLRALRRWADNLSPFVALDPPDRLVLDITGCAHLFGGEDAMGVHARRALSDMMITSRIGVADTKGAARALARFGGKAVAIAQPGETAAALEPLPLAGLDLDPATLNDLARVGLKTIGDLYAHKGGELARRFGLDLTATLAHAVGHTPDPVSPTAADAVFAARMTLPEPIGLIDDLERVLDRLSASVCDRLQKEMKGARRFYLTVRCVDTGDHVLRAGFAKPTFEPGAIRQQFAHPLDKLKIEFGADWFRLCADQIEPMQPRQIEIINGKASSEDDVDRMIATLGNRLGYDRVRRVQPFDSHVPELEFRSVEAINEPATKDWPRPDRPRPLRLFPSPERLSTLKPGRPPLEFEWRRTTFQTKTAQGPERLTPDWWRVADARTRDYWSVATDAGPRLWLMTYPGENPPAWYVAGRFP